MASRVNVRMSGGCLGRLRTVLRFTVQWLVWSCAAFVDAGVLPDEMRAALSLRTSLNNPGPHLGAFVLPPNV